MSAQDRRLSTFGRLACGWLAAAAMATASTVATAEPIMVYMDHARILKLDRPISKVIVGSSQVADVTLADPQTIVLTGKSYGTTNLVILDRDGEPVVDEDILVSIDEANTVRVYKQTDRLIYSCTPFCEEHVVRENK